MSYHVAQNGTQLGVLSEQDIVNRLASGQLSNEDLFWTDGMADWQPLGSKFRAPSAFPPPSPAVPASINPYAAPASNVLRASTSRDSLELATRLSRLGSAMLENFIFGLCAVPLIFSGVLEGSAASTQPPEVNMALVGLSGLLILGLIIYQLVLLATRGQSLGKRLIGIRIVTHPDGENPGGVKTILLRAFVPGIIGAIPFLGGIFSLADVLSIFREDRRCLHDLIAGTQVVKGQPPQ